MGCYVVQATENLERLWARYKATHRKELRDRLIIKYLPLVKFISDRIFSRLPRRVDVRDLMSAGAFGLINAVEAFDLARGIKFETYCSVRVRGSILDELRAQDWVPRPVRTRTQKLKEAKAELDHELGRAATDQEIGKRMGIGSAQVRTLGRETAATTFVSLSGSGSGDNDGSSRQRLSAYQAPQIQGINKRPSRKSLKPVAYRNRSSKYLMRPLM